MLPGRSFTPDQGIVAAAWFEKALSAPIEFREVAT
jgi:hypothetical protein